VTGHVRVARTGFQSSQPLARPVPALPGTGEKGTRFHGQIRTESSNTTGPDAGGSPPKTPLRHTHRSVGPGRRSADVRHEFKPSLDVHVSIQFILLMSAGVAVRRCCHVTGLVEIAVLPDVGIPPGLSSEL
jgi:hypothetical protein